MKVLAKLFSAKAARATKVAAQKATAVAKTLGDDLGKGVSTKAAKTPKVHEKYGEILRMQLTKGGRAVPVKSVPTQQYIDDMLGVTRLENANVTGGWYNRQKAADALAGFKSGQHVQPVTIESVPTLEAIEKLNNIARVEQLKRAEALGELTPQMLAKREDMLTALALDTGKPYSRAIAIDDFINCDDITQADVIPAKFKKFVSGEFKEAIENAKKVKDIGEIDFNFKDIFG